MSGGDRGSSLEVIVVDGGRPGKEIYMLIFHAGISTGIKQQ